MGRVIVPIILNLTTIDNVSGLLHAPAAFPQGKPTVLTEYERLGGTQTWSGWSGPKKGAFARTWVIVLPLSSLLPSHYTDNPTLNLSCTLSTMKLTIIKIYRK